LSSLSTTICTTRPLWAQRDVISASRAPFRRYPSTKGVAIASSAQAASRRSPVLKTR
jgi:hypothetical protein